jgi:phage tail-like protein
MDFPTTHTLLRDRRKWLGERSGLAIDRDGDLLLARVPAPSNGKAINVVTTYPYVREVSGLASGPCDAVFVADTAHNRVLFVDGLCKSQAWLDAPGHFRSPRGLALTDNALLVADSGNARVQSFALPRLEANVAWQAWMQPTSLAVDSQQRVLVIDAAATSVNRVSPIGVSDTVFDSTITAQGKLQKPLFVTCDADDRVLISDAQANAVFVFDDAGSFVLTLPGPAGWQPGALAAFGTRIFVADAASGAILIFEHDGSAAQLIGEVNGWRGPVTALATNLGGDLYVKPALDATYYRFVADAASVTQGTLTAGPFDAGEERAWERAWVDARLPSATSLMVRVVLKDTTAAPVSTDWMTLPSYDVLLSEVTQNVGRFIWLQLHLTTSAPQQSPRVHQARAATAAEDLCNYLPLTYRRNDQHADGFLARWLKLVRGEFGRIEELLDDMPRLADANFAAASALPWLAQWLAFELPQIANDEERRALLARAVQLFARRGTKHSIAEFVELHTGIKPAVVEAFADRRVWILGETSRLDFDTRLPPLDPLGMVVPDENAGDGCCPRDSMTYSSGCARCSNQISAPATLTVQTPIGRAVVGESGPLAAHQIGLPLFADTAYRFCVVVDGYRAHDKATRMEIARIVDREKPAHTDYRIEYIAPETRIGLQAHIGINMIVGGDPPPLGLNPAELGIDTQLPPSDVSRVGEATLDGLLTLI